MESHISRLKDNKYYSYAWFQQKRTTKNIYKMTSLNYLILTTLLPLLLLSQTVTPQFLGWFDPDFRTKNFTNPISFTLQEFTLIIDETKHFDVVVK